MTKTNPHDNAFPAQFADGSFNSGMTIREYFAAIAMQGNLSACSASYPDIEILVKKSVEYADALIAELNKTAK